MEKSNPISLKNLSIFFSWSLLIGSIALADTLSSAKIPESEKEIFRSIVKTRKEGCNGFSGTEVPIKRSEIYDNVARLLAQGQSIEDAMRASNTIPNGGARIFVPATRNLSKLPTTIAIAFCKDLVKAEWDEIGFYLNPQGIWLHTGKVFRPPKDSDYDHITSRALTIVNVARATGRNCGTEYFEPAKPLIIREELNRTATLHAKDMANEKYYSHNGLDGSSVSDRAQRSGYPSRYVSENNNIGPENIDRAIADWISSPGHCRSLMQPDITEMGIGYAVNLEFRQGVIWVQVFGNPGRQ